MSKRYEVCKENFAQEVLLEEFENREVGKYDLETDSSVSKSLKLNCVNQISFWKLYFYHKLKTIV